MDWTEEDDSEVWLSAKTGIPQAVAEGHRRGLLNPDDLDGSAGCAEVGWPRIDDNER
jgi:hypothetical protein